MAWLRARPARRGKAEFVADIAAYEAGRTLIGTPRREQASRGADLALESLGKDFSQAFGLEISPQNTPIT